MTVCNQGEFKCRGGSKCIPSTLKCNGENDCGDFSDEKHCGGEKIFNIFLSRLVKFSAV